MNNPLNDISLVFFATTLQHNGYNDIYKYTLRYLQENFNLDDFGGRFAAIKVHNNQEKEFSEIVSCLNNFKILKEIGKQNLNNNPHLNQETYYHYMIDNYASSAAEIYSQKIDTEFVMWYEDDQILYFREHNNKADPNEKTSLEYYRQGLNLLRNNPDIFSLHHDGPETPFNNDNLFGPSNCYSFRPNIARTKDYFTIANIIKNNRQHFINIHPEMIFDKLAQYIRPNSKYIQFNSKYVWNRHIGGADFLKVKEELNLKLE